MKSLKPMNKARGIKLACLLGLHAWAGNVCVNCGKRR